MNSHYSLPPLRDLPQGRLEQRVEHLRSEITEESQSRLHLPRFGMPRLRLARPVLVAALAALVVLTVVPIGGASLGQRAVNSISSLWATQDTLVGAATDAQSMAGAYYTDARVNDATNTVDIYLAGAPQSVIDQLQSAHPGTYVIHNDAAHSLSELLQLQHSLPLEIDGLKIVTSYPTPDGYLRVGIASSTSSAVQAAQSAFDSLDGAGVIQAYGGAQPISGGAYGPVGPSADSPARRHHK